VAAGTISVVESQLGGVGVLSGTMKHLPPYSSMVQGGGKLKVALAAYPFIASG
jgi:hypothetical protein